jgi:predicted RNA-binding protein YlxR (DUF448 family)
MRDGICMVDRGRSLPGRGAYVHPRAECLDRVERSSNLARALRVPGPVRTDGLRTAVIDARNAEGNRPR